MYATAVLFICRRVTGVVCIIMAEIITENAAKNC